MVFGAVCCTTRDRAGKLVEHTSWIACSICRLYVHPPAGYPEMANAAYLASAGLCIGSIASLSQQSTARLGNSLGLIGVSSGIAVTLGLVPSDPALLAQIGGASQMELENMSDNEAC